MDKANLRLLDANYNRAREAMRVLEDYARFVLNDEMLSGFAKQLRHDLSQCIGQIPLDKRIAARDTPGDVGTRISTDTEKQRQDAAAVAQAAAQRLTEALRCLEEYSKIISADIAGRIEAMRYRSYELEKRFMARMNLSANFVHVRLFVLLTEKLCRGSILQVAEQVLAGGADCIQLREKDKSDAELLRLAREISKLCHRRGALFIMNDRADLAVLADADGVHLGQDDLGVDQVRKLVRPGMLIGKSTHSLEEAKAALAEGADYIAVGSVFASGTKPQVQRGGTELLGEVSDFCDRPIIAIGGITAQNAACALAAGATGVAVCQAVIATDDPAEAARTIKGQLPK